MSSSPFLAHLRSELEGLRAAGLYKGERVITTPQGATVRTADGREVINLCANNYLGLSSHPRVVDAAHEALRTRGYGMSSVRFICGTQDLHKTLEQRIARFVGCEDAILYAAAFDANGGLFEPLLGEQDAVISDELNHASIIDGVRLCKAQRWRYRHDDMADLERCLQEAKAKDARFTLVFSDGVFSAKYSWLSALSTAFEARFASFLQALWPYAQSSVPATTLKCDISWTSVPAFESVPVMVMGFETTLVARATFVWLVKLKSSGS